MRIILSFLVIISFARCTSCSVTNNIRTKENFKVNILFKKEGELTINNIKFDIEIADDEKKTAQGLMYRDSMKDNQGMLFIFNKEDYHYFYMKNTRIYLDIIFINAKKEIIHIHSKAIPYDETSIPSIEKAMYIFEINGGLADKLEIKKGDIINFSRI